MGAANWVSGSEGETVDGSRWSVIRKLREWGDEREKHRTVTQILPALYESAVRNTKFLQGRVKQLEHELAIVHELQGPPGLTPAEIERLALLAEECGEVAQAVGKVLRHGWESRPPRGGQANRTALAREIGDLRAVVGVMLDADDLQLSDLQHWQWSKRSVLPLWTHHQDFSRRRGGGDGTAA